MNKPVEKYTNEEEFQQLAKWWADKLNLNNWQILFQYKKDLAYDEERQAYGLTYPDHLLQYAVVMISDKGCMELTIIHELLHLNLSYSTLDLRTNVDIDELPVLEANLMHRNLEEMAKTLLRVKYPEIDRDYFEVDFKSFVDFAKEQLANN